MIRVLLPLLLWATAAGTETARVVSGQHEDFTRLVIELPAAGDWSVGRVPMGYGFVATGDIQPVYDLSRVWDRIPRTRLQSLRVDPDNGVLQLALACDCHVFPFEYRPGVIVLDIKDGPPPPGSSFETALAFADSAATGEASGLPPAAVAESYDWLADRAGPVDEPGGEADVPDLATGGISLDPLRDQLLAQISRGATDGVVEMELPGKPVAYPIEEWGELPWTSIRLGEEAGVEIRAGGGTKTPVPAQTCLADADLNISSWNEGLPPRDLLSASRTGLFGEFDRIDPVAALRAVRIHLYLGFGAEARNLAELVPAPQPDMLASYIAMARLIDGDAVPESPFTGMLGCDTAAALWAALAQERLPLGPEVNSDAILRGFLALPPHLRRALGDALADRLLQRDDADAARVVRDAVERAAEADPARVAVLDAKASLHADAPEDARAHAQAALAASGDDSEALVALVEAHWRDSLPLSPDIALTLATLAEEAEGREEAASLQRAHVLALGLSGQIDAAFAIAALDPSAEPDLWALLPDLATDDQFLAHAVLAPEAAVPHIATEKVARIARRLLTLGFPDTALHWLGLVSPIDPPELRQLAAEAALASGDPPLVLALLDGLDNAEASRLRAAALTLQSDFGAAGAALARAGLKEEAARLTAWQQDWAAIAGSEEDTWAAVARLAQPDKTNGEGPLARGTALLDEAKALRGALATLMTEVPAPLD